MNAFDLSRNFWNWAFDNPDKVKPIHCAMYFFAVEQCNRLGWKEKFGFPASLVMEAIGVKSYNTYISALNDLSAFGFIQIIEKSRNQYTANIIALSKFNKAHDKALDKALMKHTSKQSESTDSIIKQLNNRQLNNKKKPKFSKLDFKQKLLSLGAKENHVDDWFAVRDKQKAAYTETALNKLIRECEQNKFPVKDAVRICAERNWRGFEYSWIKEEKTLKDSSRVPEYKPLITYNE